jgi:putative transposase
MSNTYTQCYFHLVFAVQNHDALIKKEWKNEMEMYITGIVQTHQHEIFAIGLRIILLRIFINIVKIPR